MRMVPPPAIAELKLSQVPTAKEFAEQVKEARRINVPVNDDPKNQLPFR